MKLSYRQAVTFVTNDPSRSYWLKDAIQDLDRRDPIDVLGDLETLLDITKTRIEELLDTDTAPTREGFHGGGNTQ